MPTLPEATHLAVPPDWICEVLSRTTEAIDRDKKLPLYARHGVRHVWLVDPIARLLEVHMLDDDHRWREVRIFEGDVHVRTEPFATVELDLSALWVR
jgi:Uma2 family endonuclease